MHRGESVPMIDAAALIGERVEATRIVVLRAGAERVAVLVDDVQNVQHVSAADVGGPLVDAARRQELGGAIASVLAEVRVLRGPR
jgi:chemotaxis signal transduction protein